MDKEELESAIFDIKQKIKTLEEERDGVVPEAAAPPIEGGVVDGVKEANKRIFEIDAEIVDLSKELSKLEGQLE